MRKLSLWLCLAVVLSLPAFAQAPDAAPVPQPSAGQAVGQALLGFLSPGGVATGLGLVLSLIGGMVWFSDRRKRLVALGAYYAFHVVEDVGNEIEGDDGFDKTARYLKELDAWMLAHGWRPLKPGEVDSAKLQASALHGVEVAKTKVAEAAASAAAAATVGAPSSP